MQNDEQPVIRQKTAHAITVDMSEETSEPVVPVETSPEEEEPDYRTDWERYLDEAVATGEDNLYRAALGFALVRKLEATFRGGGKHAKSRTTRVTSPKPNKRSTFPSTGVVKRAFSLVEAGRRQGAA